MSARLLSLCAVLVVMLRASMAAGQGYCYQCWPDGPCFQCPGNQILGGEACTVSCLQCTVVGPCGPGSGCFLGDTGVLTPSGVRPISQLSPDDWVISRNRAGQLEPGRVSQVYVSESWWYLEINDDLRVTDSHPFFVDGKWVIAGDLSVGSSLMTDSGATVEIKSIRRIDDGVRVYNISVDENQTFYAAGYLVHNKDPLIKW